MNSSDIFGNEEDLEESGFTGISSNEMDIKEMAEKMQKFEFELLVLKRENEAKREFESSLLKLALEMGEKFGEFKNEMAKMREENGKMKEKMEEIKEEMDKLEKENKKLNLKIEKMADGNEKLKEEGNADEKKETTLNEMNSFGIGMEMQKWNERDCFPNLVISENKLGLTHFGANANDEEDISVRSILPAPKFDQNATKSYILYYFEARILKKICNIGIGFCDRQFPLEGKWLGNYKNSIAFWRKKRMWIDGSLFKFVNAEGAYKDGEVVGIGLLHIPAHKLLKCFATLNGELLGSINLAPKFLSMELFPAVTLFRAGDSIQTNFGNKEWRYNPLQIIQNE